jgi:hypothetical protein
VLTREEQGGALAGELGLEPGGVALQLRRELRVRRFGEQFDGRDQVACPRQQVVPEVDLGAKAVGLAQDALGAPLVVPEARFLGQGVDGSDALLLADEVKDAPRSTGSVRPGRGWRTRPPSSGPGDPAAGWGAAR